MNKKIDCWECRYFEHEADTNYTGCSKDLDADNDECEEFSSAPGVD